LNYEVHQYANFFIYNLQVTELQNFALNLQMLL